MRSSTRRARRGLAAVLVTGTHVVGSGFLAVPASAAPATCGGQTVTIEMARGAGTLNGTAGDDVILGTSGRDTINGGGGKDVICGGGGNDVINGDAGSDRLLGGRGNDALFTNSAPAFPYQPIEEAWGEAGNDVIQGGIGLDMLV
ncbi:MAG TPA: hypothetical protein VEG38_11350, partial [Acidimicrobiia bacterium]|nr:hypothetical protein [Acidimicrobiia bacterium]